jgi:hypothetical protein
MTMEEDNEDDAQEGFISRWSKKKGNNKSDVKSLTEKENVNKVTNTESDDKALVPSEITDESEYDELNDEESVNVLQNFINDALNFKFTDMDIAYGSSNNFSWTGWHQSTYDPAHFDHILITNELFDEFENEGSSVQTIRLEEYLDNGWSDYDKYISDHRPVGLSLKFYP